jgi:hypothetical protein
VSVDVSSHVRHMFRESDLSRIPRSGCVAAGAGDVYSPLRNVKEFACREELVIIHVM